jgi:hypothetical protein
MADIVSREQKLPKWAQDELRILRMRINEYKGMLEPTDAGDTDTFYDPYWNHGDPEDEGRPLPPGVTVRFKLGDHWEQYIDCKVDRPRPGDTPFLSVRAGRGLTITPSSSNHVEIRSTTR